MQIKIVFNQQEPEVVPALTVKEQVIKDWNDIKTGLSEVIGQQLTDQQIQNNSILNETISKLTSSLEESLVKAISNSADKVADKIIHHIDLLFAGVTQAILEFFSNVCIATMAWSCINIMMKSNSMWIPFVGSNIRPIDGIYWSAVFYTLLRLGLHYSIRKALVMGLIAL